MGEPMVVDGPPTVPSQEKPKKTLKRKRPVTDAKDIEALAGEWRGEIDDLFRYYSEMADGKLILEGGVSPTLNSRVACLIEESGLPFSQLVDEVYERLRAGEGNEGLTLASVRGAVLFVGQRMMYGIAPAPDADVLEDSSESCLWCWETRDMKLLPTAKRGILNVRRIARKKIHERISALSATLSALSTSEGHESCKSDLLKATEKLGKVLNGMGIRSLVEKLKQKNDADRADKDAKKREKEMIKESVKDKQNAEKEKKRLDRELKKEILQTEKEAKRLQDEAIKEEKRREKEEAEMKKQLKKQQEEAERDQRRREKEEAEFKKQLKKQQEEADRDQRRREKEEAETKRQSAIQKQATIMERFLKTRKSSNSSIPDKVLSTVSPVPDPSCKDDNVVGTTTFLMDQAFAQMGIHATEDLFKFHVSGWHKLHTSNRSSRWGVRLNPKIEVIKELKLQGSSSEADTPCKVTPNSVLSYSKVDCKSDEESPEKLADGWEEATTDDALCQDNAYTTISCAQLLIKKLLQFDKSPRPAYYGTWHKKSVVGPRHPFMKDPDLDYDVESDEEWEEEDPGESLSDCDKDDEEEHLEEGQAKSDDEDESEDGFFVPDGYLSENEGVQMQVDDLPDEMEEDVRSSSCIKPDSESDEFRELMRQQKYLNSLTEQALRKSRPLVILNLMNEKYDLTKVEGLTGTAKLQKICLQALCMRLRPGAALITDVSTNHSTSKEEEEPCHSQNKRTTNVDSPAVISDSDLLKFVQSIKACSQGINKVVESLQTKFPTISKYQLRNKVKEISHYVDNRWQVKKEVVDKLGLPPSPDKGLRADKGPRPRSIATFFSKRCLPPLAKTDISGSSPEQSFKTNARLNADGHSSNSAQIQPPL